MKAIKNFEYPEELVPVFERAKRLEWITIAYLISTAVFIYLTMGNSQAMKTALFEDLLSLTPAISFLVVSRIFTKSPNRDFPFGYHRAVSIAYLCSALALFSVGGFLVVDSMMTLVKTEHATIGTVVIFGHQIWLGYPMVVALLWGTFPAIILGRIKLPLSEKLHEKNLYTDAKMNKADWMTASAAIFGVLGIGMGWWWTDAVAALVISFDILYDGYTNLRQAVFDLMDHVPTTVNGHERDPLVEQIKKTLDRQDWIRDFRIRVREQGHIYLGEGFVIPAAGENLTQLIEDTTLEVQKLDWRIQEFVIMPVKELPEHEKA